MTPQPHIRRVQRYKSWKRRPMSQVTEFPKQAEYKSRPCLGSEEQGRRTSTCNARRVGSTQKAQPSTRRMCAHSHAEGSLVGRGAGGLEANTLTDCQERQEQPGGASAAYPLILPTSCWFLLKGTQGNGFADALTAFLVASANKCTNLACVGALQNDEFQENWQGEYIFHSSHVLLIKSQYPF